MRRALAALALAALLGSSVSPVAASALQLTIQKVGSGSGTVISTQAGIACGTDCASSFASGTIVSLAATAANGSTFTDWGGACAGISHTSRCRLSMDAVKTVKVAFKLNAELALTMAASPNPVSAGQLLMYTFGIVNHGPNASDVELLHTLPNGAGLRTATASQGTCRADTGVPVTVTCTLGTLANQARATATIAVVAGGTKTFSSVAHVGSTVTVDPVPANGWASDAVIVGALPGDPVVVAAGDIACDPLDSVNKGGIGSTNWCHQKFTGELLPGLHPTVILTLGDNQYLDGNLRAFGQSFGTTWGRLKTLIHPSPGDHDYLTPGAAGYFEYFGAAAGNPSEGYYSFDVGAWHLISLNAACAAVGGCGIGSPQEQWLQADLAAHPSRCTLAYFHFARFSSGILGSSSAGDAFWQDLYAAGADVVLSGHAHSYERFAPQTPKGAADPTRGLTEFVVGTGGRDHNAFLAPLPNSQMRDADTFGVLKLVLHPTSYDWEFVPEGGHTFTDAGTASCH